MESENMFEIGSTSSGNSNVNNAIIRESGNFNYQSLLAEWGTSMGNKKKEREIKEYMNEERHNRNAEILQKKIDKWRMRERMKTVSIAILFCLNIGVDPPDVYKIDPCARLECWIDPFSDVSQKALERIGKALQAQYERWQPRARCRISLDPTIEEVKKLCQSLRRNAKDERILFHYNGHGVPKPTVNGEIWVFNKNYTQYIPLSIYELQNWMGSPAIYVFDCSAANLIVEWFLQFGSQREKEYSKMLNTSGPTATSPAIVLPVKDFILMGACDSNQTLPMNPELPADVFTSCLTTPIKMALRWFCSNSLLKKPYFDFDLVEKVPGRLADRKTPLGELNWIFTAITDTIAWNTLPRDLFQKLFRQDLLVASLFRNYLLAERIMRSLNCNPVTYPKLPSTYHHSMWEAWDMAVDLCLSQVPQLLENPNFEYQFSPFFSEQLTAFEVWLEFGSEHKKPPEQLPIVLQVLLSQAHRLRALLLLGRFLDLGPWAVNLALSVGIFPYVLKLLQSPASELRQILVFIWTKILALDKSCQLDLVKDNGHNYFINVLSSPSVSSDQRTMAAFILSVIANNCLPGQLACLTADLLPICLSQLNDPDPLLRRWVVLCLAKFWESHESAKIQAIKEGGHERISVLLNDPIPEVRAAAVYALCTFIGGNESEVRTNIELNLGLNLMAGITDASPLVRRECIVALARLVSAHEKDFRDAALEILAEEERILDQNKKKSSSSKPKRKKLAPALDLIDLTSEGTSPSPYNSTRTLDVNNNSRQYSNSTSMEEIRPADSIFVVLWKGIMSLQNDPCMELSRLANILVSCMLAPQSNSSTPTLNKNRPSNNNSNGNLLGFSTRNRTSAINQFGSLRNPKTPPSPSSSNLKKSNSSMDLTRVSYSENHLDDLPASSDDIQSNYYEWCCEFFSKPIMECNRNQESTSFWSESRWKVQFQESVINKAKLINHDSQKTKITKFDEQIAILDNSPDSVLGVVLHSFDPLLASFDDKNGITIWDRKRCTKINSFKNKSLDLSYPISYTTSMSFINENSSTMLLTGSDDGVVRIWSHIDQNEPQMVSAWRALHGLTPGGKGSSLLTDWNQETGILLTSGNVDVIRIWDISKELLIQDIPTSLDSVVSSLTHDKSNMHGAIVAGFSNGTIRIYDRRTSEDSLNAVMSLNEHKDAIVNAQIPKCFSEKLISGSASGEIRFWDLRKGACIKQIEAHSKEFMSALAIHDYAPIIASGSQKQKINIYNHDGEELGLIRFHIGFLGQRIGPISTLAFHPYFLILAGGATDCLVSLYQPNQQQQY